MAAYLYNGICIKVRAYKKYMTIEQAKEQFPQNLNQSIYNFVETEDYYIYELDKSVLEENIIDFLSEFYKEYWSGYKWTIKEDEVLNTLKECNNYDDIIKFATEEQHPYFQLANDVRYQTEMILISGDGKIIMESSERFLKYLERISKYRYKDNILSGALKVFIE